MIGLGRCNTKLYKTKFHLLEKLLKSDRKLNMYAYKSIATEYKASAEKYFL